MLDPGSRIPDPGDLIFPSLPVSFRLSLCRFARSQIPFIGNMYYYSQSVRSARSQATNIGDFVLEYNQRFPGVCAVFADTAENL